MPTEPMRSVTGRGAFGRGDQRRRASMRRALCEVGQDLVEFALVAPLLLFLLYGLFEAGWVIYSYNTISNAAREGARHAVVLSPTLPSGADMRTNVEIPAEEAALRYIASGALPMTEEDTVQASLSSGAITVAITYTHDLLAGFLPRVTLRAASTMQME